MSFKHDETQDRKEIQGSDDARDSNYESSSDGQRAGRFYGPDSSWRYYTQNERALAASLQQTENNNLSIALYDVHAIKARARGSQSTSAAKPWHSKERWIQPDRHGKLPFQPPAKWTAWPLRHGAVPRSREVWGIPRGHPNEEADTYSKMESWKPSLNLQEELKACFLRQAKKRFNDRLWEDEIVRASNSRSPSRELHEDSNNGADPVHADSTRDDEQTQSGGLLTPVFLADDDVTSNILQPTVRHIISRQDALLFALHQSRRGLRMDRSFTTRAKRKAPSRTTSPSHAKTSVKSARKRKRVISDAVKLATSESEDHQAVETSPKPPRKPRGQYKRFPGQRDWSEVLGVAAMTGWEQSVIDRAARRCAALFGEGMNIRLMTEAPADHLRDQVVEYVPEMIPSVDTHAGSPIEALLEEDSNACPHQSCRRHQEPYEKRWRLREHLKKAHNYNAKELEEWKLQAIKRGHRTVPTALPSSQDEGDADNETGDFRHNVDREREGFLLPITVRIGRSRDKRPRASASRSRSKKAAVECAADEDVVGGGSAMSTNLER